MKTFRRGFAISLLALVAIVAAQAPQIAVTVGDVIINFNHLPASTVTFGIASGTAVNNVATLNLSANTSRLPPGGVQFDLIYPASVTALSVAAGPTATAAGKSVTCNLIVAGDTRCIISGVNQNTIANGVVAVVTATVNATSTITIQGEVAATVAGTALNVALSTGVGTVTEPTVVASVSCVVPSYDAGDGNPSGTYNIETNESTSCTLTLNQAAPAGGTVIPISASLAGLTLPSSVTVAAGVTTATFTVTGQ